MSQQQQDREIQVVTGQVTSVITRPNDKWIIEVTPQGSQYTKNLWTKDYPLVQQMEQSLNQWFDFTCGVSHYQGPQGPTSSLWINGISTAGSAPQTNGPQTQAPTQQVRGSGPPPNTISQEVKEDRIMRQTAMKVVAFMLPYLPEEERNAQGMIAVAEGMVVYFKLGPEAVRSLPPDGPQTPSGPGAYDEPPPFTDADAPLDPEEPAW